MIKTVISPTKKGTDLKGLIRASEKARGIFTDYNVERDNPLRRKGAADFLGRWDKQNCIPTNYNLVVK